MSGITYSTTKYNAATNPTGITQSPGGVGYEAGPIQTNQQAYQSNLANMGGGNNVFEQQYQKLYGPNAPQPSGAPAQAGTPGATLPAPIPPTVTNPLPTPAAPAGGGTTPAPSVPGGSITPPQAIPPLAPLPAAPLTPMDQFFTALLPYVTGGGLNPATPPTSPLPGVLPTTPIPGAVSAPIAPGQVPFAPPAGSNMNPLQPLTYPAGASSDLLDNGLYGARPRASGVNVLPTTSTKTGATTGRASGSSTVIDGGGAGASAAQMPELVQPGEDLGPREIPYRPNLPMPASQSIQKLGAGRDAEEFLTDFANIGLNPSGLANKPQGMTDADYLAYLLNNGMFATLPSGGGIA